MTNDSVMWISRQYVSPHSNWTDVVYITIFLFRSFLAELQEQLEKL